MTKLFNDPAQFTEDMLAGFLDANSRYVVGVPGGVVRAHKTAPGKVAVVVGGGSGHYPAFCGVVGPGFADGAVVGNIFTSPSADEAASVARAAHSDAGVLLTTGNYAGDVMNFNLAVTQLRSEGIDAHYFAVTDDIASAPKGEEAKRRGIAGDFTVFKCASAAAEDGLDLPGVIRVAEAANAATRTFGVAFDGCTLPGADEPLFTVPEGKMGIGLGIHGEPGVADEDMPTAADLAKTLVDGLVDEKPVSASQRIAVILNGLGRTKYEELFVVWGTVARLLRDRGYEIVEPEVGELVTSLDMAGCSLTMNSKSTGPHRSTPRRTARVLRLLPNRRVRRARMRRRKPRWLLLRFRSCRTRTAGRARTWWRGRSTRWRRCSPTRRKSWAV